MEIAIVILSAALVAMLMILIKKQWDISSLKIDKKVLSVANESNLDVISGLTKTNEYLNNRAIELLKEKNVLKEENEFYLSDIKKDSEIKEVYRKEITDLVSICNGLKSIIQKQSAALELADNKLFSMLTAKGKGEVISDYIEEILKRPRVDKSKYDASRLYVSTGIDLKTHNQNMANCEAEGFAALAGILFGWKDQPKNEPVRNLTERNL